MGEHYSVVVAGDARPSIDEWFARKILGSSRTTAYKSALIARDGRRFEAVIRTGAGARNRVSVGRPRGRCQRRASKATQGVNRAASPEATRLEARCRQADSNESSRRT
jgi:hypothetical protein